MTASATTRRIAVLAPMVSEIRPFLRTVRLDRRPFGDATVHTGRSGDAAIVAMLTNIGTAPARQVTDALLDEFEIDQVVVIGIAGAVDPALAIGDLITPTTVIDDASGIEFEPSYPDGVIPSGKLVTSDDLIRDPERLDRLRERGVVAVDMETSAIAAVCHRREVPWSVYRAISDRAGDATIDESLLAMANADGTANAGGIGRFLLRRPHKIPHLVGLARGMRSAAAAAADAAIRHHRLAGSGSP